MEKKKGGPRSLMGGGGSLNERGRKEKKKALIFLGLGPGEGGYSSCITEPHNGEEGGKEDLQ